MVGGTAWRATASIGLAMLALVAWTACGDAFIDGGSEGSGAGGTASSGPSSGPGPGSGSGGGTPCMAGGTCHEPGASCTDNACCPCILNCTGGVWEIGGCAGCAQPECGPVIPEDGASCDTCGPQNCFYAACANDSGVQAKCIDNGSGPVWNVDTSMCTPSPPCGDDVNAQACDLGDVCVIAAITTGPETTLEYVCEPNPCLPYETSCQCAEQLCVAVNAPICTSATSESVHCENGAQ
jgi:hypothetical protein